MVLTETARHLNFNFTSTYQVGICVADTLLSENLLATLPRYLRSHIATCVPNSRLLAFRETVTASYYFILLNGGYPRTSERSSFTDHGSTNLPQYPVGRMACGRTLFFDLEVGVTLPGRIFLKHFFKFVGLGKPDWKVTLAPSIFRFGGNLL
jgi:hypothetical protein